MKLLNAFSLQMLPGFPCNVEFREIDTLPESLESYIGHADTAHVLGVEMRRESIVLKYGETFYVAQLQGGRLPEGVTTLPKGFKFRFFKGKIV